jgi:hypothetical protein
MFALMQEVATSSGGKLSPPLFIPWGEIGRINASWANRVEFERIPGANP